MIRYVHGDLIKLAKAGEFDVIGHGVNCYCRWNTGMRTRMKRNFHQAFMIDKLTTQGDKGKLGTVGITHIQGMNLYVVNCYIQHKYGNDRRHCDYDAMRSCMRHISKALEGLRIGLPAIGSGGSGGDWNIIEKIIEEELEEVTVVLYE